MFSSDIASLHNQHCTFDTVRLTPLAVRRRARNTSAARNEASLQARRQLTLHHYLRSLLSDSFQFSGGRLQEAKSRAWSDRQPQSVELGQLAQQHQPDVADQRRLGRLGDTQLGHADDLSADAGPTPPPDHVHAGATARAGGRVRQEPLSRHLLPRRVGADNQAQ